jgi:protein SCO1/2
MRRPFLIAVVVVLAALVVWRASAVFFKPEPLPDDFGAVADFALTERSGRTVHRDDLLGKVWVAGFAFTRCTGPCPQVSGTMARLQNELKDEPDFRLVSFSVDPDHDTPSVLKAYADVFAADPERWLFLTGDRDELDRLVRESFLLGVQRNPEAKPGEAVTHSTRLALVDRRGRVMGYFEGRQVDETGQSIDTVATLTKAVRQLLRERP